MKKDDDKALKRLQELKVLLAQHDEVLQKKPVRLFQIKRMIY